MIGHRVLVAALVFAGTLVNTSEAFAQRAFLFIQNIQGELAVDAFPQQSPTGGPGPTVVQTFSCQ